MARRANSEGSIYKRGDGRWCAAITVGTDPDTGKPIRRTVYAKTKQQALDQLDELRRKRKLSAAAVAGKDSVAAYLERWLSDEVKLHLAAKTHVEYEMAVRRYVTPYIGAEKLNKLNGETLTHWQGQLARKGFSAYQRKRAIKVLRAALNRAVKLQRLAVNPCTALTIPKHTAKEVSPLEPEECHRLFEEAQKHRIGDVIVLAAMTGLRKGELFALEWSAVNLSEGVLVVRRTLQEVRGLSLKEPKSRAGRRVVTLGSEAVAALERRLKKACDEGMTPDVVPIIFPDTIGGHLRGSNFDRNVWYPIRKRAGIREDFRFHDLRHTQASLMLAAGADLKVIQQRLGHADFATTANTYTHLLQAAQIDATNRVDELMQQRKPELESDRVATQRCYTRPNSESGST